MQIVDSTPISVRFVANSQFKITALIIFILVTTIVIVCGERD